MNNALKNTGSHDAAGAGRGSATVDSAPGKRTLTESMEGSSPVQRKADPDA